MTQAFLIGGEAFSHDAMEASRDFADLSGPMISSAKTILGAAKATVPRQTGALSASMRPSATPIMAEVSSTLVYANPIHWGWRGHGIEPSMWLVDAAHRTEPKWIQAFIKETNTILNTMDKDYRALS